MIYGIYGLLDTKSEYIGLSVDMNNDTAIRNLRNNIMTPGTMMNRFPEDYRLFKLGEFDSVSGQIDPYIKPEFIYQGSKDE